MKEKIYTQFFSPPCNKLSIVLLLVNVTNATLLTKLTKDIVVVFVCVRASVFKIIKSLHIYQLNHNGLTAKSHLSTKKTAFSLMHYSFSVYNKNILEQLLLPEESNFSIL